ncbi:acyltransferase family protein [Desulfothermus naphthae]
MYNTRQARIKWVDYAKGITIILVIYHHVIRGLVDSKLPVNIFFFNFSNFLISSIEMPLFFMVSGFFVKFSIKRYGSKIIINKLRTLMYPYLIWSWILISLRILMSKYINHKGVVHDYLSIFYLPYDIYWFLYVLFLCFLLYFLLNKFISERGQLFFSILFYCIQLYHNFYFLSDLVMKYFVFFVLGAVSFEHIQSVLLKIISIKMFFYVIILFIIIIFFTYFYVYQQKIYIFFDEKLNIYNFIIGIIGIILISLISNLLYNYNKLKILSYIGENTLYIYVSHTIFTASTRIFLIKILNIDIISIHIILGIFMGLLFSILLYKLSSYLRISYLYKI